MRRSSRSGPAHSSKTMKFSNEVQEVALSQTPLSSVSMSTTPGSSSASRFHSWKCSYLLVIPPDLRLFAVADHDDGVVVEEVRDGVPVVREILLVRPPEVLVDVLAFHEQERDAVDEPHDVRATAVDVAAHPQLAHAKEIDFPLAARSRRRAGACSTSLLSASR